MKITIIALGSRGDVQPYVALGAGLRKAGHAVQVLASNDFRDLVTSHGLMFFDMGGSIESVAQGMEGILEGGNLLKILSSMGPAARRLVTDAVAGGLAASQGSNLLVAGLGGLFVGVTLSEKLGIPFVPAYLYPFTPTKEFPTVLSPSPGLKIPTWLNRFSHSIGQQMMWQAFRAADIKVRREVLGMPAAPFWGPFASLEDGRRPVLCGYSPHVIPPPRDWPSSIHVTGYWLLEPPVGWEPPGDLVAFLQSGPPPVYIGFGSMVNRRPEEVADLVFSALERAGQRGVVSAGWGGLGALQSPDTVCMIGSIPHTWLFPRMAAVVHHGGSGTTAAGLRAGVPSIVTPFFGDQPFWGQRVFDLGVGPRPIPRRNLTADRLATAISTAVSDQAMRGRSALLGNRIHQENGVRRAVELLEQEGNRNPPNNSMEPTRPAAA